MTPDQQAEILRLRDANVAPKQIARKLKLRPAEVSAFIRDTAETVLISKAREGKLPPVHECLVNSHAFESLVQPPKKGWLAKARPTNQDDGVGGLTQMIVTRQDGNHYLMASYLIDYWCLGVKDVILPRQAGRTEYASFIALAEEQFKQPFVEISLEQAQSVVYGAVDYARSLGLEPHRDFNTKAEAHLGTRPDQLLPMEFGKNGQPCYISGPYDDAPKIISTLEASVGKGNFEYVSPLGDSFSLLDLLK